LPEGEPTVAIFCSASCENAPLNQYVSKLSKKLVKEKRAIICGGGDRYTMGAILDGVRDAREIFRGKGKYTDIELKAKGHITGISTWPIAAAETDKGTISPDYSFRELAGDIYERMAKMLVPAQTVVVAPGGAGTIQEWMGLNILKEKMPGLFKDKKLVVFDPDLLSNPDPLSGIGGDETPSSSLQNKVFDKILAIVLKGEGDEIIEKIEQPDGKAKQREGHKEDGFYITSKGVYITYDVKNTVGVCISGNFQSAVAQRRAGSQKRAL
jgi:predicted Rossmann-fold nucleotide-binding protein